MWFLLNRIRGRGDETDPSSVVGIRSRDSIYAEKGLQPSLPTIISLFDES